MKKWWEVLLILIIIVLMFWVLKDIDFKQVYSLLKEANLFYLILSITCLIIAFLFWVLRFFLILKPYVKTGFWYMINVCFISTFFSIITPGAGVIGEPIRAYLVKKKYKKPFSNLLGYVLGDTSFKLITMTILIIFSLILTIFYFKIAIFDQFISQIILIVLLVIIIITIIYLIEKSQHKHFHIFKKLHSLNFIKKRFNTPNKFIKHLHFSSKEVVKAFKNVLKSKRNMTIGISISLLFWFFNFLVIYFLFLAFNYKISFLAVIIVFTLSSLVGALSLFPGGVGVFESTMILLFTGLGIDPAVSFLVAFLSRIIFYVFALTFGGLSLIHLRIYFHRVRKKRL